MSCTVGEFFVLMSWILKVTIDCLPFVTCSIESSKPLSESGDRLQKCWCDYIESRVKDHRQVKANRNIFNTNNTYLYCTYRMQSVFLAHPELWLLAACTSSAHTPLLFGGPKNSSTILVTSTLRLPWMIINCIILHFKLLWCLIQFQGICHAALTALCKGQIHPPFVYKWFETKAFDLIVPTQW